MIELGKAIIIIGLFIACAGLLIDFAK